MRCWFHLAKEVHSADERDFRRSVSLPIQDAMLHKRGVCRCVDFITKDSSTAGAFHLGYMLIEFLSPNTAVEVQSIQNNCIQIILILVTDIQRNSHILNDRCLSTPCLTSKYHWLAKEHTTFDNRKAIKVQPSKHCIP